MKGRFYISIAAALVTTAAQVWAFRPTATTTSRTNSASRSIQRTTIVELGPPSCKILSPSSIRPLRLSQGDLLTSKRPNGSVKSTILKSLAFLSILALVWKRQALMSLLSYVKNDWLLKTLDRLNAAGPVGLVAYTIAFLLLEMTFGITTPVETAAGMAFGAVPGILASGTGKFLGALLTFFLARYSSSGPVQEKMKSNELLSLMEESVEETPFRVALLCRFSPLPEFVKNAGMGVLPVPKRWFMASLILHGLSFTCLWTCMGAETASVIRGSPPSKTLKILTTGATWIGFGAPLLIGFWIKNLREKKMKRRRKEESSSKTDDA